MHAVHDDKYAAHQTLLLIVTVIVWLALAAVAGCTAHPSWEKRIGVFGRTPVLVAYYRSDIHARTLHELRDERERALAAGDEQRAADIEARGGALQELAHRQLAGDAPLGDILAHLEHDWPAIAEQAGVEVIIEESAYSSRDVQVVDVTDLMVARFTSAKSESTREKGP